MKLVGDWCEKGILAYIKYDAAMVYLGKFAFVGVVWYSWKIMIRVLKNLVDDLGLWSGGWRIYLERKLRRWGTQFETNKGILVDVLMARRGTYQRPFLHLSIALLAVVGYVGAPILANAYPGAIPNDLSNYTPPSAIVSSLDLTEYGVQTQVSEKPRDQVITYTVVEGDTFAKIADRFGVSIDTVKWANDIQSDNLKIGQQVKIPPVTGVVHKVQEGDTVYSIAKKYKTDAQKIVNFPFNDFSDLDTFALNVGQTLVVPDGVEQEAAPIIPRAPYGPPPTSVANGTGQFLWPTVGVITQYPIWYHMALDIANPSGPAVSAAETGTVSSVQFLRYDYGRHVMVDHGNGTVTLYAHLQEVYVKVGDRVSRGQVIGKMGSTGRSTGTHLHFEVRRNGVIVNPLSYLK